MYLKSKKGEHLYLKNKKGEHLYLKNKKGKQLYLKSKKGDHLYFKTKKGEYAYACIHPFCNLEQQLCQCLHYCSLSVHTNFSNNFCSCWLIIGNYDTMSIGTEKKTSLKLYWGLFLFYFFFFFFFIQNTK